MLDKKIQILKNSFGNHTRAAKSLGVTPRYYRSLRNGKIKPGKSLLNLINIMIEQFNKGQHPENTRY